MSKFCPKCVHILVTLWLNVSKSLDTFWIHFWHILCHRSWRKGAIRWEDSRQCSECQDSALRHIKAAWWCVERIDVRTVSWDSQCKREGSGRRRRYKGHRAQNAPTLSTIISLENIGILGRDCNKQTFSPSRTFSWPPSLFNYMNIKGGRGLLPRSPLCRYHPASVYIKFCGRGFTLLQIL